MQATALKLLALVAVLFILAPVITNTSPVLDAVGISNNNFMVRVGTTFLAFAILAIGLNVVVGYAGLLDLGYVAFFGLAGYFYAYLASDFVGDGIHLSLALPFGERVHCRGEVLWVREPLPGDSELSPGAGIAFRELSNRDERMQTTARRVSSRRC